MASTAARNILGFRLENQVRLVRDLKQTLTGPCRAVINLDVNISVMGLWRRYGRHRKNSTCAPYLFPMHMPSTPPLLYILPSAKEDLGVTTEQWSRELLIYVKPRDACGAWRWR